MLIFKAREEIMLLFREYKQQKKLAGARESKSIYLLPAYPRFKNNYTLQNGIICSLSALSSMGITPWYAFFVCLKNEETLSAGGRIQKA